MEISLSYGDCRYATVEHSGDYSRIALELPGHDGIMKISFAVPILDMQGYWVPELRTPSTKIDWRIESKSAGQRGFPYLTFFNTKQLNRFSVGTTNLIDDTKITAKMNQADCCYELAVEVALGKESREFELIIDQRPLLWTEVLAAWRGALDLPETRIPAAAWEPVYCTWYAVHAAVTQDWVEENARIASELGFGTLIIDDGWCFDAMRRVSPRITAWYEMIGDWRLSTKKFPDFVNHRKRVQAMGMKYILWVAPFLIGVKSELFKELSGRMSSDCFDGCHTFDSRSYDGSKLLIDKMKHVIADYELDGLKIDFLDFIFPDIENPRGEATMRFIRELIGEIRGVNPEALIEFRQEYSTPGMAQYGTQFRAGDVPFDFIDNFHRLAQIRISMGDGVPVHADPVYWHPRESAVNISRHLIASLVGVPMLSMDLPSVSETGKNIIHHWLGFYREHRQTLNHGKWRIVYHQSAVAYALAAGETENIVILQDPARLGEACRDSAVPVYILNLSADELLLSGAVTWDGEGMAGKAGVIPPGGLGKIG